MGSGDTTEDDNERSATEDSKLSKVASKISQECHRIRIFALGNTKAGSEKKRRTVPRTKQEVIKTIIKACWFDLKLLKNPKRIEI